MKNTMPKKSGVLTQMAPHTLLVREPHAMTKYPVPVKYTGGH